MHELRLKLNNINGEFNVHSEEWNFSKRCHVKGWTLPVLNEDDLVKETLESMNQYKLGVACIINKIEN